MALVSTLVGMGTILGGATGAGFMGGAGVIGVIAFAVGKALPGSDPNDIVYSFKIGLDGAGTQDGYEPLAGAGGHAPKIRVFDNQGRQIGKTSHRVKCVDGQDNCLQTVGNVKEQPAYALLTGKRDAICIAAVGVTYPSGDKYGWVGNWAHTCCQPWYYSDIDAQYNNGTVKLDCAWLGAGGHEYGYSTGIRIHFPEFQKGFAIEGKPSDYYCKENNTALAFYKNVEPKFFDGTSQEDLDRKKAEEKEAEEKKAEEKKGAEKSKEKSVQSRSLGMNKRSIQSHHKGHSAKYLCQSKTSMGPSLVSMTERSFCHMPDKVIYPFCSDVTSGACWDHKAHAFDAKGPGAIRARAALPEIHFDKPMVWGKK